MNSEEADTEAESTLFVFQLRSFPCLDAYLQKASLDQGPYVAHVTAQKRFDALLTER